MSSTPIRGLRFALARVTVEFETALTIGTGTGDDLVDSACVLDANGLPTLPATSIAGVLRQAFAARHHDGQRGRSVPQRHAAVLDVEDLFGFQLRDNGESSRVEVSWGQVHDSKNRPVPLRTASLDGQDPVLQALMAGVLRDHVRINDLGVADDGGKFDELLVPAGTRFTFELLVHQGPPGTNAEDELKELIGLLNDPGVRLGGRTRRGYGVFKVAADAGRTFDLSKNIDREAFLKLPRELSKQVGKDVGLRALPRSGQSNAVAPSMLIFPQDHFMFGTGVAVRDEHRTNQKKGEEAKAHDKVPVTERRISWAGDVGRVTTEEHAEVLVPSSAIKGALKHRALFHARRKAGIWATVDPKENRPFNEPADDMKAADRHRKPSETDKAVNVIEAMFGSIKAREDDRSESARDGTGMPGRLFISDLYLPPASSRSAPVQHVSLDRFTQAPMDGLLYSEAPISGGAPLELRVQLVPPRDAASVPEWCDAVKALNAALEDLAEGRLALGAGANKGFGYFKAKAKSFDPLTGELR